MSRIIQGEDEETDIIYNTNTNSFYDEVVEEYEEFEVAEDEDGETVIEYVYEDDDEDIGHQIRMEAESILFQDATPALTTTTTESTPTTTQKDKSISPTPKQTQVPQAKRLPIQASKIQEHLEAITHWTQPNTDLPRAHHLELAIRNTRTSAITTTTAARLFKEECEEFNKQCKQVSQEVKTTLDQALWLDRFVIAPRVEATK